MHPDRSRLLQSLLTVALLAGAVSARADGGGDAILGAVIGAATGALVGHQLGGRDGAVIGSALGGATGAALAAENDRQSRGHVVRGPVVAAYPAYTPPPVVYAPPAVYPAAVYTPPAVVYAPVRPWYGDGYVYGYRHHEHEEHRFERWGEERHRHGDWHDGGDRFDRR